MSRSTSARPGRTRPRLRSAPTAVRAALGALVATATLAALAVPAAAQVTIGLTAFQTDGHDVVVFGISSVVSAEDGDGAAGVTLVAEGAATPADVADAVDHLDATDDPTGGAAAVAVEVAPLGGYWTVGADGVVVAHRGADHHGDLGGLEPAAPLVDIVSTPTGNGYWLAAADGGVFAYGDATFHGSAGNLPLVSPVVGIAATPTGNGYWLAAADGGVFAYGDATFHGSIGGTVLDAPIVDIDATPSGRGYWFVATDGGVFAYGDAPFYGSLAGSVLSGRVKGVSAGDTGYALAIGEPWVAPEPEPELTEAEAFYLTLSPERIAMWDRLAVCESTSRWDINTGNGYYGGIQFTLRSWRAVGGTGYPHEHTRIEQIYRGELLHDIQGWGAWPACTRKFGWR